MSFYLNLKVIDGYPDIRIPPFIIAARNFQLPLFPGDLFPAEYAEITQILAESLCAFLRILQETKTLKVIDRYPDIHIPPLIITTRNFQLPLFRIKENILSGLCFFVESIVYVPENPAHIV